MKRYFLMLSAVCLCLIQEDDKQRISSTSSASPHLLLFLKRRIALLSFCLVQFVSESDEDLNFAWNGYPEEKILQWG